MKKLLCLSILSMVFLFGTRTEHALNVHALNVHAMEQHREPIVPGINIATLISQHISDLQDFGRFRQVCKSTRNLDYGHWMQTKKGIGFYNYKAGRFISSVVSYEKEIPKTFTIEIKYGFALSDLITQEIWVSVMGDNPSYWNDENVCPDDFKYVQNHQGENIPVCMGWPVTNINYIDAQNFLRKINERNSDLRYHYDLPHEEEYEYAARGGNSDPLEYTGRFGLAGFGNVHDNNDDQDVELFKKLTNVGNEYRKGPGKINQFEAFPRKGGAHDLLGTIHSWTKSKYYSNYKEESHVFDRLSKDKEVEEGAAGGGSALVLRGCYWFSSQACVRAARRSPCYPSNSHVYVGLRLLRTSSQNLALEPLTLSSSSKSSKRQKTENK